MCNYLAWLLINDFAWNVLCYTNNIEDGIHKSVVTLILITHAQGTVQEVAHNELFRYELFGKK